jgi:hypothetical protein
MPRASVVLFGTWCIAQVMIFECSSLPGFVAVARATGKEEGGAVKTVPSSRANATSVNPSITIDSFDCFKVEGDEQPGRPAEGQGIAAWNGGGPGGATWTASKLLCVASIRSTCTDGSVTTDFRIGKALVSSTTAPLRSERVDWQLPLRSTQWEGRLDDVAKPNRAPYRTALFRVTASLTCRAPYDLHPGIGPRADFTADRMFVAGFSRGE